jgi:hypothetical protein
MAIKSEIGIISKANQGSISTKRYKKEEMLIPFSVIYLIKDMALVNQIKQINMVPIATKYPVTLFRR